MTTTPVGTPTAARSPLAVNVGGKLAVPADPWASLCAFHSPLRTPVDEDLFGDGDLGGAAFVNPPSPTGSSTAGCAPGAFEAPDPVGIPEPTDPNTPFGVVHTVDDAQNATKDATHRCLNHSRWYACQPQTCSLESLPMKTPIEGYKACIKHIVDVQVLPGDTVVDWSSIKNAVEGNDPVALPLWLRNPTSVNSETRNVVQWTVIRDATDWKLHVYRLISFDNLALPGGEVYYKEARQYCHGTPHVPFLGIGKGGNKKGMWSQFLWLWEQQGGTQSRRWELYDHPSKRLVSNPQSSSIYEAFDWVKRAHSKGEIPRAPGAWWPWLCAVHADGNLPLKGVLTKSDIE